VFKIQEDSGLRGIQRDSEGFRGIQDSRDSVSVLKLDPLESDFWIFNPQS
jgi:hypothetical protein